MVVILGLLPNTMNLIGKRRKAKSDVNAMWTRRPREEARGCYLTVALDVKKSLKNGKGGSTSRLATKSDEAAATGNMMILYQSTKTLVGNRFAIKRQELESHFWKGSPAQTMDGTLRRPPRYTTSKPPSKHLASKEWATHSLWCIIKTRDHWVLNALNQGKAADQTKFYQRH